MNVVQMEKLSILSSWANIKLQAQGTTITSAVMFIAGSGVV